MKNIGTTKKKAFETQCQEFYIKSLQQANSNLSWNLTQIDMYKNIDKTVSTLRENCIGSRPVSLSAATVTPERQTYLA